MSKDEVEILQEELRQFQEERDEIRNIIGSIGGKRSAQKDTIINIVFVIIMVFLFIMATVEHVWGIKFPLPSLFSIEIGLLLVSIKIIWMIHKQMKVEHFQFWILNSIEYRINEISKKVTNIEEMMNKAE